MQNHYPSISKDHPTVGNQETLMITAHGGTSSNLQSANHARTQTSVLSHGRFLQAPTEKARITKQDSTTAAAAFLWRRNGSELDLEGKLTQELEVGYKWLPPLPNVKQAPHQPLATYPSTGPATHSIGTSLKKPQAEPVKPWIIEVHHDEPRMPMPDRDVKPNSIYFNDGRKLIDFVMVYEQGVRLKPVDPSRVGRSFVEKEKLRQFFQENLHKDGLELEEEVHQEDNSAQITVFVKVHGTWSALCRQAEILKIKMPLRLRDTFAGEVDQANPMFFWKLMKSIKSFLKVLTGPEAPNDPAVLPHHDGHVVTWAFQRKKIDKYAIIDQDTFFTPTQRMEMVWEILQKARNDPGDEKKRGIEQLLELGVYDSAFPLHDGSASGSRNTPSQLWCVRQRLRKIWANWSCTFRMQPLELIRRYYGEKIGFYFAFLGFYTKMLAFPAVVGLGTFFYGLAYSGDDALVHDICEENKSPGNLSMCPICQPPRCESNLLADGCWNAKWDYRMDNEATLAMACLTVIWATVFLKMWKRREAELAYEWDTYEVEQSDDVIRPEYETKAPSRRHNPVTRELEPHVPVARRAFWMAASISVTLLMLAAVGFALTSLVLARIYLYGFFKENGIINSVECARWFVHGLIFIVVLIFDKIYNWIGMKTTSLECPRTQNQWLSSFLWKVFIFELLNDFVPIAYAAFVKGKFVRTPLEMTWKSELCDSGGCMGEVTELIAVLLLARLVVGNASEIALPFVKQFISRSLCNNKSYNKSSSASTSSRPSSSANTTEDEEREENNRRQWSRDLILGDLELDGVADEYMEMIVQFAFVTLFVPAFPVAPFVCLLNNILEIRVDAINFVVSHRRPLPIRAPGIQIWNSFMDIIAKVAIICNAALISFTSEMIPRLYYKHVWRNGSDYQEFTRWSLSSIPMHEWSTVPNVPEEFYNRTGVTECYYQDYRHGAERNYEVTQRWWEVMCVRLVAFSCFIVAAFTFQWLYNFIVPDVPTHVQLQIQRRRYVVAKAMEAEMAYDKWLKNALHGKSTTCQANATNGSVRTSSTAQRPITGKHHTSLPLAGINPSDADAKEKMYKNDTEFMKYAYRRPSSTHQHKKPEAAKSIATTAA